MIARQNALQNPRHKGISGAMRPLLCLCLILPLGACGFDKYDGRWTANVPPAPNCCPMRVVLDVDGHKVTGSYEDCDGAAPLGGHVNGAGTATLHAQGRATQVQFTDVNFQTAIPADRCKRAVEGNRGG